MDPTTPSTNCTACHACLRDLCRRVDQIEARLRASQAEERRLWAPILDAPRNREVLE